MATTKRKQLEYRITEKLIAMSQTNDLDKIYQFYTELAQYLTTKQLNVIDMYSYFGFENFEEQSNSYMSFTFNLTNVLPSNTANVS